MLAIFLHYPASANNKLYSLVNIYNSWYSLQRTNDRLIESRAVFIDVIARLRVKDIDQLYRRRIGFDQKYEVWSSLKLAVIMDAFGKFIAHDEGLLSKLQMIGGLLSVVMMLRH